MTKDLFSNRVRGVLVLGAFLALLMCATAGPALAAGPATTTAAPPMPATASGVTATDTSACTDPLLSQPFLWARDSNWYTLVPGEAVDSFNGAGWTLGGGASVISTQLQSGQTGTVLNLPSNGYAVSPAVCVTSDYPTARTLVRNVAGSEGVQFYVSYAGTSTWMTPRSTGQFHGTGTGWTLPAPLTVQPANKPGWQIVRFAFMAGGKASDFQLYDFYVDPRMKH